MKRFYNFISLYLLMPLLFVSCKDNFGDIAYPDQDLALSVDQSDLTLDIANPDSKALTFEWTPGTNYGSNAAIHYSFELAKKGTGFSPAVSVQLKEGNRSVAYTMAEFNTLLLEQLGVSAGEAVALEARVTAQVQREGVAPQVSETISLQATTYKPVSSTLYLIGSAAPNGWSADKATKLNVVQGSAGSFVWQGALSAGELKFITTLGSFIPSYNKGSDDKSLYYRESESDSYDVPFTIKEAGIYKITLNLITKTIDIVATEGAAYSELWFVGGFSNWKFIPMVRDANDPFIFRYNAVLTADTSPNDFKIATKANFEPSTVFLRPEVNGQRAGTGLPVVSWSENENASDFKWTINNGVYKIKLDLRENTVDIVPFTAYANMYLVGDATPKGWEISSATPMDKGATAYIFTWTGQLTAGEMKFTCDKQSDWSGAWFVAPQNGLEPTGSEEQMLFSNPGSNPDNKWKITTAGTYKITLDQLKETVIIQKQ